MLKNIELLRQDATAFRRQVQVGALIRSVEAYVQELESNERIDVKPLLKLLGRNKHIESPGKREGNVDFVTTPILRDHQVVDIRTIPELLSGVGVLIDSRIVIAADQVIEHYRRHLRPGYIPLIDHQLASGYKPHIDIIREFPHSYFEHPGYVAPAEDLFDSIALRYYVGERTGDSEDGGVGWLLNYVFKRTKIEPRDEVINTISRECKYWQPSQLNRALTVWETTVGPALLMGREAL